MRLPALFRNFRSLSFPCQVTGMVGIGVDIDILGLQFGIEDRLAGVQAAVSRQHIADTAGQSEIQQSAIPE